MSQSNLPMVIAQPAQSRAEAPGRAAPRRDYVRPAPQAPVAATFEAQLQGQDGRTRGLKGGPPVLEAARSAYLETEFSGEADRRPPTGLLTRTQV